MGYKLTGDMGYTSNWADALEKCVINGTQTTICEFGREWSFYGDGALWAVGISRKTGHKWLARHAEGRMKALEDRSRAPKSVTCRTTHEVERLICTEKRLHSTWGPKKIQQVLLTKHCLELPPAVSTVGEVLKRHCYTKPGFFYMLHKARLFLHNNPENWFPFGNPNFDKPTPIDPNNNELPCCGKEKIRYDPNKDCCLKGKIRSREEFVGGDPSYPLNAYRVCNKRDCIFEGAACAARGAMICSWAGKGKPQEAYRLCMVGYALACANQAGTCDKWNTDNGH